ncbi:uncharacterized protein LOC117125577 isoform X2 [Anneissia japonica]|uniref:uncharacterized protein LOC117125577 isoform X2 n=1 Tax=Anneissia japonica TaxID=1529436 RepID=UPI0014256F68|nr:uncharacterized protein LOC117125577 isoform X2 [Anneissia japonica]
MKPTLSCKVCNKVFHTRFNQHQCDKCGKVFARHYNFVRHLNNKHGSENNVQSGYGAGQIDEPTTKRQKLSNNGLDFYQVTNMTEVSMKKFKTKGIQYSVKFNDDLDIRDSTTILSTLHKVFQSLIDTLTEGAHPDDLIRMVVECPELDYPIQLPLVKKRHLTADLFLARVERVLQSYEEFSIDGSLEIHITHVEMSRGGKIPKKRYVDLERFLKEKQRILRIRNKDELCCARAIVTAKAKIEQPKNWEAIRKGYKIQQKLAVDLHHVARVPLAKFGINEIKQFQHVLPPFQIIVASLDYGNAIIYRGPPAKQQIYLYHHNNHYDVITSMPAFLNRSYFCIECMKGYNNKLEHRASYNNNRKF